MDAISAATAGMRSAISSFDTASANVTNAFSGASNADPATAIVDQTMAGVQFRASAATLKVADDMYKSLLDIMV
jgi:flagellar basal body rod protein FlgG